MAIIRPSNDFEGSDVGGVSALPTGYLRQDIKKMIFSKTVNTAGAYVLFLPSYKVDAAGKGVWFKVFEVRDNFGEKFKEKYYVPDRAADPASHFAKNYLTLYKGDGKFELETVTVNGRSFKKYPNFGRITKRVLFNVAYAADLNQGVFVLDLPLANGGSILTDWSKQIDMFGKTRPYLNDPDRALPVFLQLKDSGSNPWVINVDTSQAIALPEAMADSNNLYNLDTALVQKPKEEVISKLREMYPADVFEACMSGFSGFNQQARGVGFAAPAQVSLPTAQPPQQPAMPMQGLHTSQPAVAPQVPVFQAQAPQMPAFIPQVQQAAASIPINTQIDEEAPFIDPSELPPNPMLRRAITNRAEAERFLNQQ
jgi:hypothetical protein